MFTDSGELLFETDEMDFIAIRLDPSRPAMRVPTLFTGGSFGERNGGGEEILNRVTHDRMHSMKKGKPHAGGCGGFPYSYSARLSREGGGLADVMRNNAIEVHRFQKKRPPKRAPLV
jgi:hypothetical protein